MRIKTHLPDQIENIGKTIVDCSYRVHKTLGSGLLESVYETCLIYELKKAGLKTFRQVKIPFQYDGQILDLSLCLDVLIQDEIIIELKAVENMIPLYKVQLISYLKLTNKRLGYLINFNVPVFKEGIQRIIV